MMNYTNIQFTYAINGQVLQQVEAQSDLGVMIWSDSLRSERQVLCQSK